MKPISSALGPLFADLERRAQASLDLTGKVREALGGVEKDHVVSASYKEDVLVVMADSSAWSSRIYYMQKTLIERLRAQGETHFTKVQVKVGRQERKPTTGTSGTTK